MSMSVLVSSVVTHLRSTCSFASDRCDIQPMPGMPPFDCGLDYVAVCPGATRFGRQTHLVYETYDVTVVYTRRTSDCPRDRRGRLEWLKATTGVDAKVRQILLAIHGNETLIYTTANANFAAGVNGFLELLAGPSAVPPPEPVGNEWFGGDSDGQVDAGLKVAMTFSGAKRFQDKASAT